MTPRISPEQIAADKKRLQIINLAYSISYSESEDKMSLDIDHPQGGKAFYDLLMNLPGYILALEEAYKELGRQQAEIREMKQDEKADRKAAVIERTWEERQGEDYGTY